MALVTDKFRIYAAESFRDTLLSTNRVYMFIGRAKSWGTPDSPPANEPIDSFEYHRDSYRDSVAFKRIDIADTALVVPRIDWIDPVNTTGGTGKVYSMYKPDYSPSKTTSNGSSRLFDSNYYVMNSEFNVYKCLYNGQSPDFPKGRPSLVEPTGTSTTVIETGDSAGVYSYRWKYMYTLGINDFVKFVSSDFMPVKTNTTVQTAATSGAVDQALVRNVGSGITAGTYFCPVIGDGTGAVVTFTVSSTAPTSGQIDPATVAMTVVGSGYTYGKIDLSESYTTLSAAQARTATPLDLSSGSPTIDAIISPPDGHGSNIVREMGAYRVMINKAVEFLDGGGDVPVNMEFRRFGLISDPKAPGGQDLTASTAAVCKAIKFPTATNVNYSIGETITQATTGAKGVVIHWDSVNKILRYYQNEYVAATQSGNQQYQLVEFSGANAITGATSNTVLTPDTAATGTVTIAGISFTTGYAASEVQKFSGSILYIENRKTIIRSDDQTEDIKLVIEF